MDDGRPVTVSFAEDASDRTTVTLTLALETENSEELQRKGWGEMLGNLGECLG